MSKILSANIIKGKQMENDQKPSAVQHIAKALIDELIKLTAINNENAGQLCNDTKMYQDIELEVSRDNAYKYISRGLFEQAFESCKQVLEIAKLKDYLIMQGYALARLELYDEAKECFDRILEENPKDVLVLQFMALLNYEVGNYGAAINFCDKVHEIKGTSFSWCIKGLCYKDLDEYDEVLPCFDKALELDPEDLEVLAEKYDLLIELEEDDELVECMGRIIDILSISYSTEKRWEKLTRGLYPEI